MQVCVFRPTQLRMTAAIWHLTTRILASLCLWWGFLFFCHGECESYWPAAPRSVSPGPWCTSPWQSTSKKWRALCTGWPPSATLTRCSPAPAAAPGWTGGPNTRWKRRQRVRNAAGWPPSQYLCAGRCGFYLHKHQRAKPRPQYGSRQMAICLEG